MAHERIGHIRFPASVPTRRNAPTTGGMAAPDERVEKMLDFIEKIRVESQLNALNGALDVDKRAQGLGGYHDTLLIKSKFVELFVTPITKRVDEEGDIEVIQVPPTVADEPEGDEQNEATAE